MLRKQYISLPVIKILIVDDHQIIRDGIKTMLASQKKQVHFLIDEAENGEEALRKVLHKDFDVILIDYQLQKINGAETTEEIMRYKPDMPVLALSNYDELAYIEKMIACGAKGYILKDIDPAELVKAIKTLLAGKNYFSSEIGIKLFEAAKKDAAKKLRTTGVLSKREKEILILIAQEMTNEEIAKKLFVTKKTVDTHRQNLLVKLGVRNTVGLIVMAFKMGLLDQF